MTFLQFARIPLSTLLLLAFLQPGPLAYTAQAVEPKASWQGAVTIDELEYRWQPGADPLAWSATAMVGTEQRQVWLVSEGDRARGVLGGNEMRGYYSHQVTANWRVNAGWRGDTKPEPDRHWFLLGLEGEAPYGLGTAFTAYQGKGGDTALRLELDREFLLAGNLLLVPELKLDAYRQDDPQLGRGRGLSTVEAAVRLAYPLSPGFTPYIGASWITPVGQTEDYARFAGGGGSSSLYLIGVSIAF